MGAEAVVTELMSIGGECLAVESRRIIRPSLLALTNVRLDHLETMGRSKEAVARTLAAGFPDAAPIILPEEERSSVFTETAVRRGSRIIAVRAATAGERIGTEAPGRLERFEPNLRLALAVLESLGVDQASALRGMDRSAPDFGSLRLWRLEIGRPPRPALGASAFAANDPESSAAAVRMIRERIPPAAKSFIGVLALREDRGDRTLQWTRASGDGFFDGFAHVAVIGPPARAAGRRIRRLVGQGMTRFSFPGEVGAAALMDHLVSLADLEPVIIGLGNIIGFGERIIRYWEDVGVPYGD